MNNTVSTNILTESVDAKSLNTTLELGYVNANEILIGSNTTTPQIMIDTLSTLNTNANPAIGIGTSSSTKTIKINNSTNSVHLSGLDIKGTGLNNITATSGQVDIAQLQTSGDLNIATNASRTSNVNVGSLTNTGAISLQTASTLNTDGSPAVSIGTAGSVKTIKVGSSSVAQTVNVAGMTTNFNGTTQHRINSTTITNDVFLASNQTTGVLYLGAGDGVARSGTVSISSATSSTNDVNIKTGTSTTGNLNILNGLTSGGNVNIATGSGASQTTAVNISTGTTIGQVTIGNEGTLTQLRGGNQLARATIGGTYPTFVEVSTDANTSGASMGCYMDFHSNSNFQTDFDSRIKAIGGTVADGQATLTLQSKTVAVSGALTYSSTIGASYSSLPARAVTDIGYIYTGTAFNATTPASGSTVSSITIATAGVYTISFAYYTLSTAKPTELYCNLSGGEINGVIYGNTNINATNSMVFGNQIFKQDTGTSTTYNLVMARTGGTGVTTTVSSCYFKAVKIA